MERHLVISTDYTVSLCEVYNTMDTRARVCVEREVWLYWRHKQYKQPPVH